MRPKLKINGKQAIGKPNGRLTTKIHMISVSDKAATNFFFVKRLKD